MRSAFAAVLVFFISAVGAQSPSAKPTSAEEMVRQLNSLGWVHGPATVPIGDQANIRLPKGLRYLDPENTKKFLTLNGNPPDDNDYTIAPEGISWFSILEFQPMGYVSDKDKVDPDALFKQIKADEGPNNEQRKAMGESGLYVDRWLAAPHYDAASHNLEWGTVMHTDGGDRIINYTSRILGRDGVMKAILVSDPNAFQADLSQYRVALAGFGYLPDKRYEAHKSGDKLAEYGLGALVAGGAAAAVVKTGLFAGLLKLLLAFAKPLIVGVVALVAAFRAKLGALFGRRTDSPKDPPA
ncbi:DUF2167 domain-containing protein [Sphingomonas crusticola]|uniref:DUF2167 domain-containing protein n=1 Tax=Sphingomonas crusticola TaxID=1697973 RepID=UPI000E27DE03|nr:DUF2167 domain-containing protein [Sphingomonas crusticola]